VSTIATLAIKLVGDTTQLKASFDEAASTVQRAGQTFASVGAVISGAVTAPLVGLGMTAVKVASDQEQLQIAFTTMLGSAERAKELMNDLAQFAAETPFELPEVTGAAKQLMAFGVEAEDVQDTLRRLGNLAAGVGSNVGDLAYLFGTSRVQGRLFAADVNQFTNRGIPLIEALAATMGVATTEIRGMTEDGKIGFEELNAAIIYLTENGGKFSGLMEAQSQSLQGLFSTAKDNVMLTLGEIGKVAIREFDLVPKLKEIIAVLEVVRASVSAFAAENPKLFTSLIMVGVGLAAVGPALTALGAALMFAAPAVSAIGAVIAALLSPVGLLVGAVALLGAAWATNVGGMRDATTQALTPLIEQWGRLNTALANTKFTDVLGELLAMLTGINSDWYDSTVAIYEFTLALTGSADAASSVQDAVYRASDAMQAFRSRAADLLSPLTQQWGRLDAALKHTKITDVLGELLAVFTGFNEDWYSSTVAIRGFVDVLTGSASTAEQVRSAIVAAGASFREFGRAVRAAAAEAVSGLPEFGASVQAAFGKIAESARSLVAGNIGVSEFAQSVKDAFSGIDWSPIAAKLEWLRERIIAGFEAIKTYDYASVAAGIQAGMVDAFNSIDWTPVAAGADKIRDVVVAGVTSVDWAGAFAATTGAIGNLRDAVIGWATSGINGVDWGKASIDFAGFVDGIVARIRAVDWSRINPVALFLPLAARLVPGVGQAIGTVKWLISSENFAGLSAAVVEAVRGIDWSVIADAMRGLGDAVNESLASLDWTVLTESASSIQEEISGLFSDLQIDLPEVDFSMLTGGLAMVQETMTPSFERLREALATVPESFSALQPAISGLGESLGGLLTALQPVIAALGVGLTWVATAGVNLLASTISRLPGIVEPIINQVTATINMIASTITAVTGTVAAIADGDWAAAWESMKGIVTAFQEFVSSTWENVTTQLGSIAGAIGEATTNTLADIGFEGAAEAVQGVIDKVVELGGKIGDIFQGGYSFAVEVPGWISQLMAWSWPTITMPAWIATLIGWMWPTLTSPGWIAALMAWSWPRFISVPSWVSQLMNWSWPTLSAPGWVSSLFSFQWPSFPGPPAWLSGLLGGGDPPAEQNALGTSYFRGGLSLVGEMGPEVVALPRGAQVFTARESKELLAGAGSSSIVIQNVTIQNETDMYELLHKLENLQRRRR